MDLHSPDKVLQLVLDYAFVKPRKSFVDDKLSKLPKLTSIPFNLSAHFLSSSADTAVL